MTKTLFYCRTSTRRQNLQMQIDAARKLGCAEEDIYVEQASGADRDRPILAEVIDKLETGDTLACYKLDRIGRSMAHVAGLLEEFEERGIKFKSTSDNLTTEGATGRLLTGIMISVSNFERDLIQSRVKSGLESARKRGVVGGRPRSLTDADLKRADELMKRDSMSAEDVSAILGCSRRTLFRRLKEVKDRELLTA